MTQDIDPSLALAQNPRGISPSELVQIYRGPLEAAAISIGVAEGRLERLQALPDTDDARVNQARANLNRAEVQDATLRATGHAGLRTIVDFPARDVIEAQMAMDRRSAGEADALFDHVEGLNTYARTAERPVVLVVGRTTGGDVTDTSTRVYFIRPETDEGGRAASIVRGEDGEHRVNLSVGEIYALNPVVRSSFQPLRRETVGPAAAPSSSGSRLRSVNPAAKDVVFADDYFAAQNVIADGVSSKDLVRGRIDPDSATIIYGSDAVVSFVSALGESDERLRPLLHGVMANLGRSYQGPGMETPKHVKNAQEAFMTDTLSYLYGVVTGGSSMKDGSQALLVSSTVQRFVGLPDYELAKRIESAMVRYAKAGLQNGEAVVTVGDTPSVEDAWSAMVRGLHNKGFESFAAGMGRPDYAENAVLSIKRSVLRRALDPHLGAGGLMSRREIRAMRASLREVESGLTRQDRS